jgi:hypothetical protein
MHISTKKVSKVIKTSLKSDKKFAEVWSQGSDLAWWPCTRKISLYSKSRQGTCSEPWDVSWGPYGTDSNAKECQGASRKNVASVIWQISFGIFWGFWVSGNLETCCPSNKMSIYATSGWCHYSSFSVDYLGFIMFLRFSRFLSFRTSETSSFFLKMRHELPGFWVSGFLNFWWSFTVFSGFLGWETSNNQNA